MTSTSSTAPYMVVATDLSDNAAIALAVGADLARKLGARVTLLYAIHPVPYVPPLGIPDAEHMERSIAREMTEASETTLKELKARYFGGIGQVDVAVVEGPSAAAEICAYARSHAADWVVVGTHGRTGLGHMLIGSVAERVVRHAPCSVVVARPKDAESSSS